MSECEGPRDRVGSRLGFLLLAAGCAIGLGNIWKFPYMVGQYGGGVFVLLYIVCLVAIGIPLLSVELSMGRGSQKSPVRMYDSLKPGSKWRVHGYVCLIGTIILMAFYTVITGLLLRYFITAVTGGFEGIDSAGSDAMYDSYTADPVTTIGFTLFVVVLGFLICALPLNKGLERVNKVMMIALLSIIFILAVNSLTVPGAMEGLKFYLVPDLDRMAEHGFMNILVAAMSQAFFTLSIGIGSMAIFGSYLDKDRALFGESVSIASIDLFVAFVSGLVIFPACMAYGVAVDSGPNLIFVTLPAIFSNMAYGSFWGALFFMFLFYAAMSTVMTVFECISASFRELFGWTRWKSSLICLVMMSLIILPCALGFNVLSWIEPLGAGTNILDLEDFIVSYLMLPGGALLFLLFCTMRYGWGWDSYKKEVNSGIGLKVPSWMRAYMSYVLPVMVTLILIIGLISKF
ncbi:MAG: sodium-dependent transporter [Candidatus Methanomethylophilaceae archaeon]|nr:sodium-dependent transporter [Candidatus Methanomethylophilaceae archaeon]